MSFTDPCTYPNAKSPDNNRLTVEGITVSVERSALDGKLYVQIDTSERPEHCHDDDCNMRVYFNDAVATRWEV